MAAIRVWSGWRAVHNDVDVSRFEWIEFEGEPLGSLKYEIAEGIDNEYSFYRLSDGRIIVAEHRYGDWSEGGLDYGVVSVYSDLDEAAARGWYEYLVRIGAYDAPTRNLDEWLNQYDNDE